MRVSETRDITFFNWRVKWSMEELAVSSFHILYKAHVCLRVKLFLKKDHHGRLVDNYEWFLIAVTFETLSVGLFYDLFFKIY